MSNRVRCYFDVTLNSLSIGRIVFELYNDLCPKTCENFRALCTGEAGIGESTQKHLYYKVTYPSIIIIKCLTTTFIAREII